MDTFCRLGYTFEFKHTIDCITVSVYYKPDFIDENFHRHIHTEMVDHLENLGDEIEDIFSAIMMDVEWSYKEGFLEKQADKVQEEILEAYKTDIKNKIKPLSDKWGKITKARETIGVTFYTMLCIGVECTKRITYKDGQPEGIICENCNEFICNSCLDKIRSVSREKIQKTRCPMCKEPLFPLM